MIESKQDYNKQYTREENPLKEKHRYATSTNPEESTADGQH